MRFSARLLLVCAVCAATSAAVADEAPERAKSVKRDKPARTELPEQKPRQPETNQPRSHFPSRPSNTPSPPPKPTPSPEPQPVVTPITTPVQLPAPAPPVVYVEPGPVRLVRCESAVICALDPIDDYVAWEMVARSDLRYETLVHERLEGWTWRTILRTFEISDERLLDFLYELAPDASLDLDWNDDDVSSIVGEALLYVGEPELSCSETFLGLPTNPRERRIRPEAQLRVAEAIAKHTGSCTFHLLAAYDYRGRWSAVAEDFSISPRLFGAVFNVATESVASDGSVWLDYPSDGLLYDAVSSGTVAPLALESSYNESSQVRRGILQWGVVLGVASLIASLGG